jgi:hypothetical protein
MEAIEHEAEARGATVSDWVRSALQAVVELDPGASRHASLLYETAKTRALFLRWLDRQLTPTEIDALLMGAEEDATEYVRERVGKEASTG